VYKYSNMWISTALLFSDRVAIMNPVSSSHTCLKFSPE
jgi:hypothetical protein